MIRPPTLLALILVQYFDYSEGKGSMTVFLLVQTTKMHFTGLHRQLTRGNLEPESERMIPTSAELATPWNGLAKTPGRMGDLWGPIKGVVD